MRILVYSETNASTIRNSLGAPEYSYYFVLKEFLPALRELGEVVVVSDPGGEVDPLYRESRERGQACVFLSFSPPHKTQANLECPTIPVFAWEFDSIPHEVWLRDFTQDWPFMLRQFGQAITHSQSTVAASRKVLHATYPMLSVPAPVWDSFAALRALPMATGRQSIRGNGVVFDSWKLDLQSFLHAKPDRWHRLFKGEEPPDEEEGIATAAVEAASRVGWQGWLRIHRRYLAAWYLLVLQDLLPNAAKAVLRKLLRRQPKAAQGSREPAEIAADVFPQRALFKPAPFALELEGVVFTTVFNPYDGRKNWQDLITAFCTAFADTSDAVLLFKLTHREYCSALTAMARCMARLPEFRCRVLLVHGYLEDADYQALMTATSYVVNASFGEGQCLPLMEFLSCGKPAIAPVHSGMSDYIDEDVAFVVDSWAEATAWPHDPRSAIRTCRQQIDWTSLVAAYRNAYRLFREQPEQYREMADRAVRRMEGYCSRRAVNERLRPFLAAAAARAEGNRIAEWSVAQ